VFWRLVMKRGWRCVVVVWRLCRFSVLGAGGGDGVQGILYLFVAVGTILLVRCLINFRA
jgi:hypothetical protein